MRCAFVWCVMNNSWDERQAAAKPAENDQAGQLRPVPFSKQPCMVCYDPDEFFMELLMEQNEQQ